MLRPLATAISHTPSHQRMNEMSGGEDQQQQADEDSSPVVQHLEEQAHDDNGNEKMFFTTSDLIERMNQSVAEISGGGDASGTGFELRRQMPDGSTRRADAADTAAADLQSKIKQTAAVLSGLTSEEKVDWAKAQRLEGNSMFAKGQYNEAMDIYITCLVAMDKLKSSDGEMAGQDGAKEKKGTATFSGDIERDIQLPVLLNLALCALKLGMLRKAESFCNFALQTSLGQHNPKVYFRRGRARMLMGSYDAARTDLEKALEFLTSLDHDHDDGDATDAQKAQQKAVQKELQKLERLEITAKKHEVMQKKAMKRVWGERNKMPDSSGGGNAIPTMKDEKKSDESTRTQDSQDEAYPTIGQNKNDGLYSDVRERRQFSTIRAKKENSENDDDDNERTMQSYVQWYLSLFERCLRKTLRLLGDEEGATMGYYDKDD